MRELLEDVIREIGELQKSVEEIGVSHISKCLRMAYYDKEEQVVSDAMVLGLDYHDWYGNKMAELLFRHGYDCATEVPVVIGNVKGRIDVVCESDNMVNVIELKFTANPTFTNAFLPFYRRQLMYYMSALAADYGHLVLLPFKGVEPHYIETVPLSRDVLNMREDVEKRAARLVEALRKKEPPERETGPWCEKCRYRAKCFTAPLIESVKP